jgi:hypothetical protein
LQRAHHTLIRLQHPRRLARLGLERRNPLVPHGHVGRAHRRRLLGNLQLTQQLFLVAAWTSDS